MTVTLEVSMPFLLAGLVVGLIVSVFQAVTSIQEQTLTFIPKILVTGAVIVVGRPVDARPDASPTPRTCYTNIPYAGRPVTASTLPDASAADRGASGFLLVLCRVGGLFVLAPVFSAG